MERQLTPQFRSYDCESSTPPVLQCNLQDMGDNWSADLSDADGT